MRLVSSIYCDFIQSECFNFTSISGNCPGCQQKLLAAAYDMIDYWGFDSDTFMDEDTSDFTFTSEEKEKILEYMIQIEVERSKIPF